MAIVKIEIDIFNMYKYLYWIRNKSTVLSGINKTNCRIHIIENAIICHCGYIYEAEKEEMIFGYIRDGINYLKITKNGDFLKAEWTQDKTGFNYIPAYDGYYNEQGQQILKHGIELRNNEYKRF